MMTSARKNLQAIEPILLFGRSNALDAAQFASVCEKDLAKRQPCKKETTMKPPQQLHDLGQSLGSNLGPFTPECHGKPCYMTHDKARRAINIVFS